MDWQRALGFLGDPRERARSRVVRRLGVLDDLAEPGFDRFVGQAAEAFAAPMALLTLLHDRRLWVKAALGIELRCVPRQDGFCTVAVERGELLEVCDARAHPTFRGMPSVTGVPYVRYYLGAPLRLEGGTEIGALCIVDTKPRQPASRDQRAFLLGLARQAAQALEQRAHVRGGLAA